MPKTWTPVGVDNEWDNISDDMKFRLWNWASSALMYGNNKGPVERKKNFDELCQELTEIMRNHDNV